MEKRMLEEGLNNNNINTTGRPFEERTKKNFPCVPLDEILQVMHQKERRSRITSIEKPVFAQCRAVLVEWMVQVGEAFRFDNITIHTSVALLDRLLLMAEQPRGRLQLIATGCLLIAAKLDEQEETIPSAEELNYCTDNSYSPELIIQIETWILNQLHWDITIVTPAHFLGIYVECCLADSDRLNGQQIMNHELLFRDVSKLASFFVDICRQDHTFLQYLPSLIGASCVFLARKLMKISPSWPDELSLLTSYNIKDLITCVDHIYTVYKDNFLGNSTGT